MRQERWTTPQRILVVDDSPDMRGLWLIWLTMAGFVVDTAANGAEAMATARQRRPDLVLMDLEMPVMDGFEAIRRLRADASTMNVLIIALSAADTDEFSHRAQEAGADIYVGKPLMPDDLLAHMRTAFDRQRRRRALSA